MVTKRANNGSESCRVAADVFGLVSRRHAASEKSYRSRNDESAVPRPARRRPGSAGVGPGSTGGSRGFAPVRQHANAEASDAGTEARFGPLTRPDTSKADNRPDQHLRLQVFRIASGDMTVAPEARAEAIASPA